MAADSSFEAVPLLPTDPETTVTEADIQALMRAQLVDSHWYAERVRWSLQALSIALALAIQVHKKGNVRVKILKRLTSFAVVGGLTEASLRAALDDEPAWETSAMSAALWASLASLLSDSMPHKIGAAVAAIAGSAAYHIESAYVNDWAKKLVPDAAEHTQRCFTRLGLYSAGFALQTFIALFIMYLVKNTWAEVPKLDVLTLAFGVPFIGQFLAESFGAWIAADVRNTVVNPIDGDTSPDKPNYDVMVSITIPGPGAVKNVIA